MHDPNLLDKLPVFTTPHQQITFYADDPSSHQQLLSIINPYDFFVKFKILVSPDCSKYSVSDAHGTIKPHHTATVTLHHLAVNSSNIGVTEKIRVFLYSTVDRTKVSGKRDLSVVLLDSAPKERLRSHEVDRFQQLEASSAVQGQLRQQPLPVPIVQEQRSNNKALYIIAIILGILVLAMPKEGDVNEYFPNILPRPTSEMKQMACFLLGILCTLLFQS
ncbi:motile sperm domain-containing protein 1-like isoform X1 [Argiope bruennichi]|uniref:motile sperm domain-containing protein 1-like isoform X1 n=1 Tax=Argiope bruennichi TaxID=94029 RepID=UPI0024949890|nr:motile sperm domain-containing protein 1-like isoform X1 [Argiope bruennichi]XP_055939099.1 motile sperm domain-containing protein 1-like isoform X1 [Argiope bruennichi]